jgi:uncharacterized protein (DUF2164 family)
MSKIQFNEEEKSILCEKIQAYCADELDQPLGRLGAETFLEFITEQMGGYFYNRGIYDAKDAIESRLSDTVSDAVFAIEQPTDFRRTMG